jgi:gluconate 2-dehydrogenase gamma chain
VGWLTGPERATVDAVLDRLIPPGPDPVTEPGAALAGAGDYIDGILDAFATDPPRIFAGGPSSGRRGGAAAFGTFLPLSRIEEIAWRRRIDGWQQTYRQGLVVLGADFGERTPEEQDARLEEAAELTELLYAHACEGMYAAPEYGGNHNLAGWSLANNWPGDVAPRGWTAAEVTTPTAGR